MKREDESGERRERKGQGCSEGRNTKGADIAGKRDFGRHVRRPKSKETKGKFGGGEGTAQVREPIRPIVDISESVPEGDATKCLLLFHKRLLMRLIPRRNTAIHGCDKASYLVASAFMFSRD